MEYRMIDRASKDPGLELYYAGESKPAATWRASTLSEDEFDRLQDISDKSAYVFKDLYDFLEAADYIWFTAKTEDSEY